MLKGISSHLFVNCYHSQYVCTSEYVLLFLVQMDGQDLTGLLLFAAISDIIALVQWKCNSLHKMAAVPVCFPAGHKCKAQQKEKGDYSCR